MSAIPARMGLVRLTLVDGDSKRRAAICHCLSGAGIHVEPYEDAREVVRRWPEEQVLLVHDDEGAVVTLVRFPLFRAVLQ
ncbi:MAG TPA: hypothetical protein VF440_06840 [Novosphingobium sp.]